MKKHSLIVLLLALALVPVLRADTIVYNNGGPNQQNGNEMSEWIQTEDFTLNGFTTITDIHFWDVEGEASYLGSIYWWITGDNNGNPDPNNILASGVATPTHTATGNCLFFGCEYENSFDITALGLAAGTYHLALHNGDPENSRRLEFYWETTDGNGTITGIECDLSNGACDSNSWFNNGQEHAFNLTGNPVPEPSSIIMLGTGALGVLGSLRKRFLR